MHYLALFPGSSKNPLLDGTLADESINGDLLGLTKSMCSVHGLLVYRGVPVRVVENNLHKKT